MEGEERSFLPEAVGGIASNQQETQGDVQYRGLIERLHLQEQGEQRVPDASRLYTMLVDLGSEKAGEISPELHETIRNVSLGFGFLTFDQLPDEKKAAFLQRIYRDRTYRNRDRITLTPQQAEILQHIANALHIAFDPGQPEEESNRVFPYADFENRMPDGYQLHDP